MLVVAADHRLARRRRVEMAELGDEDWIIRSDHPVVEVLQRSAVAAGFEPKVSFRANDYQEAQAMVGVGLGIAVAPRTAVLNRIANVRVIPLGPRGAGPPGPRRSPPRPGGHGRRGRVPRTPRRDRRDLRA